MSTEEPDVELHTVTHPFTKLDNSVILGKFASLVAIRRLSKEPVDPHVLKHLCLQVIGEMSLKYLSIHFFLFRAEFH